MESRTLLDHAPNIQPSALIAQMVKGDSNNHWAIKWANAQAGPLHTAYDGPRPSPKDYSPMKKP